MRFSFAFLMLSLFPVTYGQEPSPTFQSGVTMIQVPVVVRSRDGRTVSGLEKDDFELFDNGKRVEIASFAVESPGSQAAPDRTLPNPDAATKSTRGTAVDIPERFIAYFFDDVSFRDRGDMTRLRDAASRQISALQPGDRAGIFTSSCHLLVDFTNDRQQLQETLSRLDLNPPPMCRASRANVLQVEVLSTVIRRMSNLPGKREILLISPGFWVGHDRSPQAVELMEAAIRAKVVIDALDTGGATESVGISAGSQDPGFGVAQRSAANPTLPLVLVDLARGTGGTYLTGNDFAVSFRKLATPESHYVLGFVSTAKADGRLHQLKVKLAKAGKLSVEARGEYYAAAHAE